MRRSFVSSLIKGVSCLAIALLAMANKLCFADDRLLIGSFNSEDKPVQLVIANANNPMSSVLATAANQSVSSHSGDVHYNYLSGAQFLDYISYCGLDFLSTHSAKWFYDNGLFVNYSGYFVDNTVRLLFSFSKSNFVAQPIEWKTLENTGDQVFYDNSVYFVPSSGGFFFSPCWDNVLYKNTSSLYSSLQYFTLGNPSRANSSGSFASHNNGSVVFTINYNVSSSVHTSHDFTSDIESFLTNNDSIFLFISFSFSLDDYNNSVFPYYVLSNNLAYTPVSFLPLASSFYFFDYNLSSYHFYVYRGTSYREYQFQKLSSSLAVSFPFVKASGALAYESDFVLDPTPTPTPFPTYSPWDPDNPAGGTTPTPIPSGFGGVTPSPIPSVSPPAATVTPINIFYNPEISNGGDIWGSVQSIFADFNSFFSGNQFIKFSSSIMNTFYYFDPRFKYFVIPVFVCFIVFMMGRFRRK